MNKLPIIKQDKANHFIYGFAIFIICNLFLNDWHSLSIVFIFGLGKEIYDEFDYGGFDIFDLFWTILPGIILTILKHI